RSPCRLRPARYYFPRRRRADFVTAARRKTPARRRAAGGIEDLTRGRATREMISCRRWGASARRGHSPIAFRTGFGHAPSEDNPWNVAPFWEDASHASCTIRIAG